MSCNTTYKLEPRCKCGASKEILIRFEHNEISKTIKSTCFSCKAILEATLSRRIEDIKKFDENPRRFRIAGKINKIKNIIEYPQKEDII